MDAGHRQIAGMKCVHCDSNIFSVVDGKFCSECCCPLHTECFRPNSGRGGACLVCGADVNSQAIHMALSARAIAQVRQSESVARSRIMFALVFRLIAAAGCFLGFTLSALVGGLAMSGFVLRFSFFLLLLGAGLVMSALFHRSETGEFVFITHFFKKRQQK